jgi:hypothetical protein
MLDIKLKQQSSLKSGCLKGESRPLNSFEVSSGNVVERDSYSIRLSFSKRVLSLLSNGLILTHDVVANCSILCIFSELGRIFIVSSRVLILARLASSGVGSIVSDCLAVATCLSCRGHLRETAVIVGDSERGVLDGCGPSPCQDCSGLGRSVEIRLSAISCCRDIAPAVVLVRGVRCGPGLGHCETLCSDRLRRCVAGRHLINA